MGGAAAVLADGEVHCTIPQLGAEEHQHLPGEQGHIRATILQPEGHVGTNGMGGSRRRKRFWNCGNIVCHISISVQTCETGVYSLPRLQRLHINEPLKGGHERLQPLLQIAHIFLQGGERTAVSLMPTGTSLNYPGCMDQWNVLVERSWTFATPPFGSKTPKRQTLSGLDFFFFFFATGCCKVRNTQVKTTISSFSTRCSRFKNSSGRPKQAVSLYLSLFPSLWCI